MEKRDAARAQDPKRSVQRYWDAHPISTDSVPFEKGSAESFDAIYARWEAGMTERRRESLERCVGRRVLEVGCGIAIDGRYLASHGAHYQAVDYSLASLRLACRHFDLRGLPRRFANADAASLPFANGTFDVVFSSGVLHHVPDMAKACAEVVRVLEPGGRIRVMLYHRHSYHYLLVHYVVRPLVWLLLALPGGAALARLLPGKFRDIFEICRQHGFSADTILSASTDTSSAGDANFNPLSYFVTRDEVRELFAGLRDFSFYTSDLKYFPVPIPALRRFVEDRFGFFLQIEAYKPRD